MTRRVRLRFVVLGPDPRSHAGTTEQCPAAQKGALFARRPAWPPRSGMDSRVCASAALRLRPRMTRGAGKSYDLCLCREPPCGQSACGDWGAFMSKLPKKFVDRVGINLKKYQRVATAQQSDLFKLALG